MGTFQTCKCSRRHHSFIMFLLLISSWTQEKSMVEGRGFIKLSEASEVVLMRKLIGSRPPRCERICRKCGHCEAVEVPVTPNDRKKLSRQFSSVASSRDPYGYDYKPMRWKCKCGDVLYNP